MPTRRDILIGAAISAVGGCASFRSAPSPLLLRLSSSFTAPGTAAGAGGGCPTAWSARHKVFAPTLTGLGGRGASRARGHRHLDSTSPTWSTY